jgi:hypothetical protein
MRSTGSHWSGFQLRDWEWGRSLWETVQSDRS